jgi:tRNA pseudouridine13 synthase
MQSGRAPFDRHDRSFALSAARAAIFNAVLGERVIKGTWNHLQPGDLANLDGSGSVFAVQSVDDVLIRRCDELDIHPTGPLWGSGLTSTGSVAELESKTAAHYPQFVALIERERMEAERRPLRMRVENLSCAVVDGTVRLSFRLGRGSFATAVLHELIENAFDQPVEAEEA